MEFRKYNKIYTLGHKDKTCLTIETGDIIHIEEKVDGGNFRFYITKENKIIIGSRTQQLTSNEGEDTNMNKMFERCSRYIREKLKDKDLTKLHGFIFYGENMVKHTINYDWEKTPPYLGFDIFDTTSGEFLDYDEKKLVFDYLKLEMVPYLGILELKEGIELGKQIEALIPISKYALESSKDKLAEGIVLKNYEKQTMAKYVRNEFKENNAEVFGGNPKYNKEDNTNNAEITFKYCTNNRIEKTIYKLMDEGMKLEMSMMHVLPKRLYQDIMEENWTDIVFSKMKVDFDKLNKLFTKRCLGVLSQLITNNALV